MTTTDEQTVINVEATPVVETIVTNELVASPPSPLAVVNTTSINEPVASPPSLLAEVNTTYINEPIVSLPSLPVEISTGYINDPATALASPPAPSSPPPAEQTVAKEASTSKPVESVDVVTKEPAQAKTTEAPKPSKTNSQKQNIIISLFGSYKMCIMFIITSIITIAKLIIGIKFADQCPISWRIPHYLVVAGAVGCVIIGIQIVETVLTLYLRSKTNSNEIGVSNVLVCCAVCGMAFGMVGLLLFLFGWHIAGFVWVLRVWGRVEFDPPSSSNYCHPILYRFTFWLLIIGLALSIISCVRKCYGIPGQLTQDSKGKPARVPTSEA